MWWLNMGKKDFPDSKILERLSWSTTSDCGHQILNMRCSFTVKVERVFCFFFVWSVLWNERCWWGEK